MSEQVNDEESTEQIDHSVLSPEQTEEHENNEDDNETEVVKTTKQEMHTNSTVPSKQIKIVTQLNAKQVDVLISDRNTVKAHGLQRNINTKFFDSFSNDLVDIVYYQAMAGEGILEFDEKAELHNNLFYSYFNINI